MAHTGAARAGVENMTKTLAIEWAQHGINVNAIAPGNNIRSSGTAQYGDELLEIARSTPLKRLGTPEEVARVILFLASDMNDFVTGDVYDRRRHAALGRHLGDPRARPRGLISAGRA